MNLQEQIMEIISTDWVTSRELAEVIAHKFPDDFKKQSYGGNIAALSMALGPVLYALANRGSIEHDGTKWPETKHWRRIEPKERISVHDVAEALIRLHLATDNDQATRMLAARTVREHESDFKILIQEASRVSTESLRIGKKILGLKTE